VLPRLRHRRRLRHNCRRRLSEWLFGGRKHAARLSEVAKKKPSSVSSFCHICHVPCPSEQRLREHTLGKPHRQCLLELGLLCEVGLSRASACAEAGLCACEADGWTDQCTTRAARQTRGWAAVPTQARLGPNVLFCLTIRTKCGNLIAMPPPPLWRLRPGTSERPARGASSSESLCAEGKATSAGLFLRHRPCSRAAASGTALQ
jgi:hypothetical protein